MSGTIGPHTFLHMFGEVPVRRPEVEVITKPGEDGHIRRLVGVRSKTFEVRTLGSYEHKPAARNALEVFAGLIDDPPQIFRKDGVDYTAGTDTGSPGVLSTKYRVSVLDVSETSLQKKACIAGTPNLWLLECNWQLILVPEP